MCDCVHIKVSLFLLKFSTLIQASVCLYFPSASLYMSTLSTLSTARSKCPQTVQAVCLCPLCKCPPPPRYSPAAHHSLSPLLLSPRLELIYYSVAARSHGVVPCRALGAGHEEAAWPAAARDPQLGVVAAWPPCLLDPSMASSSSPPLSSQRPAPPPANGRPVGRPNTLRGELTVNADKESG